MWAYLGEEGILRPSVSDTHLGLDISGSREEYDIDCWLCGCWVSVY